MRRGSVPSGMSIREYLSALEEAEAGSLPGTSAEILDDRIRAVISRGRIGTCRWIGVVTTARELGIPTTSTMSTTVSNSTGSWTSAADSLAPPAGEPLAAPLADAPRALDL